MAERTRLAVVGAGIVGLSTAIWARRAGLDVTVVDAKGPGAGASWGNAGVLAASAIVPVTVPGLPLKAPGMLLDRDAPIFLRPAYLPRLLPWLARYLARCTEAKARETAAALWPLVSGSLDEHRALAEGTPAARFVHGCDYVFLYRDRAAFEADRFGWALRRSFGVAWEEIEGEALARRDPALAGAGFAVAIPGHGRISDPGAYVAALAAHLEAEGGRLLTAEVTDIAREGGRVTGLRAGGETIPAEAVVIAAGAWSARLTAKLGLRIPLESERGYHLELWEPSAMPREPTMIAAAKLVAAPMEGRLRLAGIAEFGGLAAGPRAAPFRLIERQVARLFPGLRWRETTRWMGHRPAPADSIPVIGAVPGLAGAWLGFGHHHVGLTAGPRTGRLLAQLASGRRPNADLAPYDPARFAR